MLDGEGREYEVLRSLWATGTVVKVPVVDSVSISIIYGPRRQQSKSLLHCGSMQIRMLGPSRVLSRGQSDNNEGTLDRVVSLLRGW